MPWQRHIFTVSITGEYSFGYQKININNNPATTLLFYNVILTGNFFNFNNFSYILFYSLPLFSPVSLLSFLHPSPPPFPPSSFFPFLLSSHSFYLLSQEDLTMLHRLTWTGDLSASSPQLEMTSVCCIPSLLSEIVIHILLMLSMNWELIFHFLFAWYLCVVHNSLSPHPALSKNLMLNLHSLPEN